MESPASPRKSKRTKVTEDEAVEKPRMARPVRKPSTTKLPEESVESVLRENPVDTTPVSISTVKEVPPVPPQPTPSPAISESPPLLNETPVPVTDQAAIPVQPLGVRLGKFGKTLAQRDVQIISRTFNNTNSKIRYQMNGIGQRISPKIIQNSLAVQRARQLSSRPGVWVHENLTQLQDRVEANDAAAIGLTLLIVAGIIALLIVVAVLVF